MNKLKIIRKSDNSIFQILDFSKIETPTGNLMTVIYDNIINVNIKTKILIISNNIGRVGGYITVNFNPKTKKFDIDPEPVIEG